MQRMRLEKKTLLNKRENNYDLLRILCAVAVITLHVSGSYLEAGTDLTKFGDYYTTHILTSCIYNAFSRYAVPCFFMLSGAFILANDRNADYRYFYRKEFKRVGMPTLVFSILYFLYNFAFAVYNVVANKAGCDRLLTPIKSVVKGQPYYHMWYLFTLLGLYILTPLVIRFQNNIEEKTFQKVVWVFFAAAIFSGWTSKNTLAWDVGKQVYYLGYFMLGYLVRKWAAERKNNKKGICLILAGCLLEGILVYLRYRQALAGVADADLSFALLDPMNPLVAAASVLWFAGFSLLEIRRDFSKLSAYTLLIYLFHAGLWDVCVRVMRILDTAGDNRLMIPLGVLAMFAASLLLSVLYDKIYRRADARFGLSDRLCKWLHFQ